MDGPAPQVVNVGGAWGRGSQQLPPCRPRGTDQGLHTAEQWGLVETHGDPTSQGAGDPQASPALRPARPDVPAGWPLLQRRPGSA